MLPYSGTDRPPSSSFSSNSSKRQKERRRKRRKRTVTQMDTPAPERQQPSDDNEIRQREKNTVFIAEHIDLLISRIDSGLCLCRLVVSLNRGRRRTKTEIGLAQVSTTAIAAFSLQQHCGRRQAEGNNRSSPGEENRALARPRDDHQSSEESGLKQTHRPVCLSVWQCSVALRVF